MKVLVEIAFAIALWTSSSMLGADAFVSSSCFALSESKDFSSCLNAATALENATPSANVLRNAGLTNASDEVVRLGDRMGKGKSIVVFLRHLG